LRTAYGRETKSANVRLLEVRPAARGSIAPFNDRSGNAVVGPLVRLKFGKQAHFMIEVERGEDSETVADKLRDLANDIAPRRK
jgi:hypothetical protein